MGKACSGRSGPTSAIATIRYDFGFENYYVVIKRLSGMGEPCATEMCWKLTVRPKF